MIIFIIFVKQNLDIWPESSDNLTMLKMFSGKSEKLVKKQVGLINALEPEIEVLTNEALKERSHKLQDRIKGGFDLNLALPEAYALVREAAKRTLKQRAHDTQLIGGINLHRGTIVEMMTGEGKTLSAVFPTYLNALTGEGVHVITVNDYLAKRDAVWMGQIYHLLGLRVSCLVHDGAFVYDPSMETEKVDEKRDETAAFKVENKYLRPVGRREGYWADITYGTNHEFGFDYLRDNLAPTVASQVQRGHNFAVIDEVDSILIDEARTPLIISAPDAESSEYYRIMTKAVADLNKEEDFVVDEKLRTVEITEAGIDKVEKKLNLTDLFSSENMRLVHYLEECLKAKALFVLDKDYVVKDGEIIIVDQFTGRLMHGRRYSGGLHQAIEARENVKVQEESKTYAQITIQNYFRLYKKISGMTGTAQTSAEEFHKVYNLETVTIPTNKPIARKDMPDAIYGTEEAKYKAIIESVREMRNAGRPVLIGTVSIEKNELLSKALMRAGIAHETLNAKNHEREGEIIAQAGKRGSVTLATNMAGRGVDIILGGSPFNEEKYNEIKQLGGLHVVGTERHDARRIDNQLRGRSGRQGDPGSSQFYLSLEDDLMRIFGGDRLKGMMQMLKIPEDQPIESRMVSKAIIEAQRKVEGINFDSRKHLLDYDDILNKQRMSVYKIRQDVLEAEGEKLRGIISGFVKEAIEARKSVIVEEVDGENSEEKKGEEALGKIADISPVEVLKPMVLGIIDNLWMNHLEDLEALSDTVRIRAYGQHDPLVEYRKESYMLYKEITKNLTNWLYDTVLRIRIVRDENHAVPSQSEKMEEIHEEEPKGLSSEEISQENKKEQD